MNNTKHKILFVIPARKNSKRIKNKNLMVLRGQPLVVHSIRTALASKLADKIVVTTDNPKIGRIAKKLGVEYIKRPVKYARDLSPDIQWLRHTLNALKASGFIPDYIVHLRPTSPLRNTRLVDEIIRKLIKNKNADAIRTVDKVKTPVQKCVYLGPGGFLKDYFNRNLSDINLGAQNFPASYTANGYVDVFKNAGFAKKIDIYQGLKVLPYVLPGPVLDIDELSDLHGY